MAALLLWLFLAQEGSRPVFPPLPEGPTGIASRYPGDLRIERDPAVVFFDDFDRVALGDRVVISSHVSLLTHDYSWTTVLVATGRLTGGDEAIIRGIRIGNNVFVGRGALLMPGTVIEDHVIIGAGAIGLELGSVWARLGSRVRVIELMDRIVPGMDADLARALQRALEKQGLSFDLGASARSAVMRVATRTAVPVGAEAAT